jgi:hypothetical protein
MSVLGIRTEINPPIFWPETVEIKIRRLFLYLISVLFPLAGDVRDLL